MEERLGRPLTRIPEDCIKPRPQPNRMAHIGVHPQKQADRYYIGVVLPVGRLSAHQMRGLAWTNTRIDFFAASRLSCDTT